MHVTQLDHLNLTVHSFEETAAWYARVFGFTVVERGVWKGAPWGILKSGDAMLCVYEHPELEPRERSRQHGLNHFALRITDVDAWRATIEREGLELNWGGLVEWPHSDAWYVNDPTGYEIEVAFWHGGEPDFQHTDVAI